MYLVQEQDSYWWYGGEISLKLPIERGFLLPGSECAAVTDASFANQPEFLRDRIGR